MDSKNNPQLNHRPGVETGELSKKEKLAFWGFVILAVVIVYLGFQQMGNNLKTPFALFALKYSSDVEVPKTEEEQMTELKNKDTDKDGLNDYEELYVYNTSPYLPDSDSDGISDKQEVTGGTDPNCPKGQNCFFNEMANPTSGQINTSTLEQAVTDTSPSVEQILLQNIFSANPDVAKIREFLLQSGGKAELINKFSDEELVAFFKEFMTSATSTLNVGTSIGSSINPDQIDLVELRKNLITNGVPKATVDKLDDAALLDLIKQL
ncbi:MAG: thrombospondin type 3 repeat-containing protein [Candidatus Magasanikbacteria bacterium]|nr:thrombospondin type 3 repeat-containing protein [Candidatus Magasanikbacteria bacterium]